MRRNIELKYWLFNSLQERVRSPRLRRQINQLLVRFLPKANHIGLSSQDSKTDEIVAKLHLDGWAPLTGAFDPEVMRALRDKLTNHLCHDPWRPEVGQFMLSEAPAGTHNARIVNITDLPETLELANSPLVLQAVGKYLGCKPTIDDVVAWWSIPGSQAPKEEQFFHRDNDAIRFVKFFIYLTDVSPTEGAHELIRGSHNSNRLLERRKRYEDDAVHAVFPGDRLLMTGPVGTAFLEDTYCLHKGTVPSTRHRLLFQVRYTSVPSVFAGKEKYRITEGRFDPYSNRFL